MSLLLWGPPGTGKTTIAAILSQPDRPPLRRGLGGRGGRQGGARGDRRRPRRAGPQRPGDGAVRRRGAPVHQGPAGRPAARAWRTAGSRWSPPPPRTRSSRSSRRCSRAACCCGWSSLTDDDIRDGDRRRRSTDERGLGGRLTLDDDALDHLVRLAGGDARRSLTYLEAAAGAARAQGRDADRPGDRRDGRRPGGGALRPAGRPALRRDLGVHQVDPRLRRRRRPALPGPDDRGGRGPALHRPPAGDPGQRGHRPGRPHGADHGGRRRPGRRS